MRVWASGFRVQGSGFRVYIGLIIAPPTPAPSKTTPVPEALFREIAGPKLPKLQRLQPPT